MEPVKKLTHQDALDFLREVKETLKDKNKGNALLEIFKSFDSKDERNAERIRLVTALLQPHPELLLRFQRFLPSYCETLDPAPACESTKQVEDRSETAPQYQSLEVRQALTFVHKVRVRFQEKQDCGNLYARFLNILNLGHHGLEPAEVKSRMLSLFSGHRDLLVEFSKFHHSNARSWALPSVAQNSARQGIPVWQDNARATAEPHECRPKLLVSKRPVTPNTLQTFCRSQRQEISASNVKQRHKKVDNDEARDVDDVQMYPSSIVQRQQPSGGLGAADEEVEVPIQTELTPEVRRQRNNLKRTRAERNAMDDSAGLGCEEGDQRYLHPTKNLSLPHSPPELQAQQVISESNVAHEYQKSLNFVYKVKERFREERHFYLEFCNIVYLLRDGARICDVIQRIRSVFAGHGELLEEFSSFIPQLSQD